MARYWWGDEQLQARAVGHADMRFLAVVVIAVMAAGATGSVYEFTTAPGAVVSPATAPRTP